MITFRDEDKDLSGKKDIADWFLVKIDQIEIAGSKCRNGTFIESKDKNYDFEFRAEFDNGCSTQSAENGKLMQSYHFAGDNSVPGLPIITSRKISFAFRYFLIHHIRHDSYESIHLTRWFLTQAGFSNAT